MSIIFLTGYSGAGKSTAANYLIDHHQFGYLSFRDVTRAVAEQQGYTHENYLKEVDDETIVSHVAPAMVQQIKQQTVDHVLIDGLYHLPYKTIISDAFTGNKDCLVVAVETDSDLRKERFSLREGNNQSFLHNLDSLDAYKKRIGLDKVLDVADYRLTNNNGIEDFYKQIDDLVGFLSVDADIEKPGIYRM